jgi:hypothetical protein
LDKIGEQNGYQFPLDRSLRGATGDERYGLLGDEPGIKTLQQPIRALDAEDLGFREDPSPPFDMRLREPLTSVYQPRSTDWPGVDVIGGVGR